MRKKVSILLTLLLLVAACTPKQTPTSLTGSWKLTSYGPVASPSPAVSGAEAQLTFGNDGTVTGNGGCNSLGGTYAINGDQVTFSEVVSTLMACDDARMAQESAVTQVLSGTATYKIEGNTLTLTKDNTVLVMSSATYP